MAKAKGLYAFLIQEYCEDILAHSTYVTSQGNVLLYIPDEKYKVVKNNSMMISCLIDLQRSNDEVKLNYIICPETQTLR